MTQEEYRELDRIAHEIWKRGYNEGLKASQEQAYEKGKEVGREEMYRQMTRTLA